MKKRSISLSFCRKISHHCTFVFVRFLNTRYILVYEVQYISFLFFAFFLVLFVFVPLRFIYSSFASLHFVFLSFRFASFRLFFLRFVSVRFGSVRFGSCTFGSFRADSGGEGIRPCNRHEIEEPTGGRSSEDRGAHLPSLNAAVPHRTRRHDMKPDRFLLAVAQHGACSAAENGANAAPGPQ